MLMAFGASTIHWSILESLIDVAVAITFHRFGGNQIRDDLPRMFSTKTEYLKKAFRRSDELVSVRDLAITTIQDAEALAKRRHLMTHGSPSEYGPDWMIYTWLKVTPTMHVMERHTVTLGEARGVAAEAVQIALPLARIVESLSKRLD